MWKDLTWVIQGHDYTHITGYLWNNAPSILLRLPRLTIAKAFLLHTPSSTHSFHELPGLPGHLNLSDLHEQLFWNTFETCVPEEVKVNIMNLKVWKLTNKKGYLHTLLCIWLELLNCGFLGMTHRNLDLGVPGFMFMRSYFCGDSCV